MKAKRTTIILLCLLALSILPSVSITALAHDSKNDCSTQCQDPLPPPPPPPRPL